MCWVHFTPDSIRFYRQYSVFVSEMLNRLDWIIVTKCWNFINITSANGPKSGTTIIDFIHKAMQCVIFELKYFIWKNCMAICHIWANFWGPTNTSKTCFNIPFFFSFLIWFHSILNYFIYYCLQRAPCCLKEYLVLSKICWDDLPKLSESARKI